MVSNPVRWVYGYCLDCKQGLYLVVNLQTHQVTTYHRCGEQPSREADPARMPC